MVLWKRGDWCGGSLENRGPVRWFFGKEGADAVAIGNDLASPPFLKGDSGGFFERLKD